MVWQFCKVLCSHKKMGRISEMSKIQRYNHIIIINNNNSTVVKDFRQIGMILGVALKSAILFYKKIL